MDDLNRELARFHRYAEHMRTLVGEAQSKAPPRSEGTDSAEVVHVVLGPDGIPASIRVAMDWRQRTSPQNLRSAVIEACEAAMAERLGAWTRSLQQDGWQDRMDRVQAGLDGKSAPEPETGGLPPAFRRDPNRPPPRPVDQIAEDMIRAFDTLDDREARSADMATGIVTGSGTSGRLTVTVNPTGLESVTAEESWLAGRSGDTLTAAFENALAAAKADLKRAAQDPAPGSRTAMKDLFDETLALLNDASRLSE
ncbi:hypothetical protein ACFOY4_24335 [Actinomadura syzygii]|uniref:YbaB/EbfC family nucleoid-associated protein n=1 Tax=Actinomadura syzygii TaxID=1427538 RepID=A0A5D0UK29_9ACTN|nr:hypothetical protein [Actinomadura syzygii]TYC18444.1 hypothetical protein FXF65_01390 [Actinomadura syzygii]